MAAGTGGSIDFAYRLERGDFLLDAAATVAMQGITGLFGPSAAGKTTLLRCIAGLDRAAEGRLRVGDETWEASSEGVRRAPDERDIGYVFQEPRLFPHLDVRRNLAFGQRRAKRHGPIGFDAVVDLLGLGALLERRPEGLSGGEAQRVAIGRAMLRAPRVMLMDEPVASLDAPRKQDVLPFIQQLHAESGIPILYVTHSFDELCQLCDQLVVIEAGRVAASGPLQALLADAGSPLLAGEQAGVLLDARVLAWDERDDLCTLVTAAGALRVPGRAAVGARIRLRIRASDVSLARDAAAPSSILNRVPVTVAGFGEASTHSILVRLEAGSEILLARITRRSVRELGISRGDRLVAQIKAVSLRPPGA
jgi:molybdate transport system ATP-binding protein